MAARHPDDPLALLVLGHAELHMGDRAAGEAAFTRLLEQQPDNVEALQFMAMARIEDAADLPDERTDLMNRARGYLATAYGADPGNYLTLLLIARSREGAAGYPNDNDLATWEMAFIAAPQLSGIRLGAGHAFLAAGDKATAIALLEPLANAPHGGEGAEAARRLIDEANGVVREEVDEAEPAAATADECSRPVPGVTSRAGQANPPRHVARLPRPGSVPPPDLRHHRPPRCGQDHPDRAYPAGGRRHSRGRCRAGAGRKPADPLGLDEDREGARHLRLGLGHDVRA